MVVTLCQVRYEVLCLCDLLLILFYIRTEICKCVQAKRKLSERMFIHNLGTH